MSAKCALGVDLGGTKIEVALVDGDGRVIGRLRTATEAASGDVAVQNRIVDTTRTLLAQFPEHKPIGLGIGVPGQVEAETGVVKFAPNLRWHNVPLRATLMRELALPVMVTNDVRAITYGEWYHGAGVGCDNLICIYVGTGIGGGIVINGQLLSGSTNSAGEVGHIMVNVHGRKCGCGNYGCMEAHAGGLGIAETAKERIAANPVAGAALLKAAGGKSAAIETKTVVDVAQGGDPLAKGVLDDALEALVAGCVSLVNVLNPQRLILGGGVIDGLPQWVGLVDAGVRRKALKVATASLTIVHSVLGKDAGVVGAAAMVMHAAPNAGR